MVIPSYDDVWEVKLMMFACTLDMVFGDGVSA